MKATMIALAVGISAAAHSQSFPLKNGPAGTISVGGRSSLSLFNTGDQRNSGMGLGGQFRIRLADRVNTDWFYDYFTAPIGDYAFRQDHHIGWSVLFYLREPVERRQIIQPYLLAGHCFDYTRQVANEDRNNFAERWSGAIQAGLGTHFNLTDRTDFSLVAQYMTHLGTDIHAEEREGTVEFRKENGTGLEGHLLFHVSFNYKLFDAW